VREGEVEGMRDKWIDLRATELSDVFKFEESEVILDFRPKQMQSVKKLYFCKNYIFAQKFSTENANNLFNMRNAY